MPSNMPIPWGGWATKVEWNQSSRKFRFSYSVGLEVQISNDCLNFGIACNKNFKITGIQTKLACSSYLMYDNAIDFYVTPKITIMNRIDTY